MAFVTHAVIINNDVAWECASYDPQGQYLWVVEEAG